MGTAAAAKVRARTRCSHPAICSLSRGRERGTTQVMIAVLFAASLAAPPSWTPNLEDPRQRVLAALVEELTRSQESLKLRGHEAPYFLSYAVRGVSTQEVGAKYGAVFLDNARR